MKFLILMYAEPGAWPPEDHQSAVAESVAICHQLNDRGQYLSAAPLHAVETARCVRVRDNQRIVSDGPFAETKEHLGGYFLVDVRNIEEAIEIASHLPGTRRGTAEVRPVVELPNLPVSSAHHAST